MKKYLNFLMTLLFFAMSFNYLIAQEEDEDFIREREEFEIMRTRNPITGKVPVGAFNKALSESVKLQTAYRNYTPSKMVWTERGPYADDVGISNSNDRPRNDIASGRIRAVMIDAADLTGKTVWVAGYTGGIWRTTDITTSPANWTPVNDYLSSLAVTDICQDPTNTNIMYFCTGDYRSTGAFRSTDHGITWSQLTSVNTYTLDCQRILCDPAGNIYIGTRSGLFRSTKASGGAVWNPITPAGFDNNINDIKFGISPSDGKPRLHIVSNSGGYAYTDVPVTVTPTSGWNSVNVCSPQSGGVLYNPLIGCVGTVIYIIINEGIGNVAQPSLTYRSTGGGAANTWGLATGHPAGKDFFVNSITVNPANYNECIAGYLDNWKTVDGGNTWNQISCWDCNSGQYVHADQHRTIWYDNGNKLIFASDGGIFYSTDGGSTIRDRNTGLRIRQYFSCSVHPTNPNYILGGTYDNGTDRFEDPGINKVVSVTGGDGGFTAIDEDQPQFQFATYIHNDYFISTDGGSRWVECDFKWPEKFGHETGLFINPYDYDNATNTIYASHEPGEYLRWERPMEEGPWEEVPVPALGTDMIWAVKVSPHASSPNLVYFGTQTGKIFKVTNANTNSPTAVNIIGLGMPIAPPSCINMSDWSSDNLIVSYSNDVMSHIWVRSNVGGTWTWTDVQGNLPAMPVWWCMFVPGDNTKAIIATETGVWESSTLNGSATVWYRTPTIPFTRVVMLKYNESTGVLAAATHGRGMYTTHLDYCFASVNLDSPITASKGVESSQMIQCFADITLSTGEYVALDAAQKVILKPGFHTSLSGDAYFKAYIDGCGNILPYNSTIQLPAPIAALSNQTIFGDSEINNPSENSNSPLYIKDDNFITEDINVYPNPSTGIFTITTNEVDKSPMEVYNSLGSIIKKIELNANNKYEVDLSDQPKGVYFLNIILNNKIAQKMIVVQ